MPREVAPLADYHLTERADADMLEIFLQGITLFGAAQARRYSEELVRCFELIAQNPNMGRPAMRLGPFVRRHEHKSHVILYRPATHGVRILALVHGRSIMRLQLSDGDKH